MLNYHSIENLLESGGLGRPPLCYAYLPVEVIHSTEVRNAQTNELVNVWPTSDYSTVRERFEQVRRALKGSERFAQLRSSLSSIDFPIGINSIVALACSTMTWADIHFQRSMSQHALALLIRDVLASKYPPDVNSGGTGRIECYAQDPIYTPADEQVLRESGFTVLHDPEAFLKIDETSVVISICPDIPVKQIIADIARPAMMIWNKAQSSGGVLRRQV